MSNKEVTAKILQWLESSYSTKHRLDGVVYIQNITKPRLEGPALKNIHFPRQLIRGNPFLSITLATSFWDQVSPLTADSRERELMQSKDFWADMVMKGSEVVRIWPDRSVCLQVLEQVGAKAKLGQSDINASGGFAKSSSIQEAKAEMAREMEAEKKRHERKLQEGEAAYRRERDNLRA